MPAHRVVRATVTRTTAGSTTIFDVSALGGAGSQLSLKTLVVGISVFAANGQVEITDGTTTYFAWEAITTGGGQPPCVNIPDGYPWGTDKDMILTCTGTIEVHVVAVAELRI